MLFYGLLRGDGYSGGGMRSLVARIQAPLLPSSTHILVPGTFFGSRCQPSPITDMKPARNAVASATYLISPRLFTPPLRDTGDGSVGRLRCSSIITSWDDCYTGIAKGDSDLLFACLWPQPMRVGGSRASRRTNIT